MCYKLRLREAALKEEGKLSVTEEAVVTLLADLQQLQEQEMHVLYNSLQHKVV